MMQGRGSVRQNGCSPLGRGSDAHLPDAHQRLAGRGPRPCGVLRGHPAGVDARPGRGPDRPATARRDRGRCDRRGHGLENDYIERGLDNLVARVPPWTGTVASIHIAEQAAAPMRSVERVRAVPGKGLEGDRYFNARGTYSDRPGPGREVTLIEAEAVEAMERETELANQKRSSRRHIITRGAPLNHLVGQEFDVGQVLRPGIRLR